MKMTLENIKDEVVKTLKNNSHVILEISSAEYSNQNLTFEISQKLDSKPFIVELNQNQLCNPRPSGRGK